MANAWSNDRPKDKKINAEWNFDHERSNTKYFYT